MGDTYQRISSTPTHPYLTPSFRTNPYRDSGWWPSLKSQPSSLVFFHYSVCNLPWTSFLVRLRPLPRSQACQSAGRDAELRIQEVDWIDKIPLTTYGSLGGDIFLRCSSLYTIEPTPKCVKLLFAGIGIQALTLWDNCGAAHLHISLMHSHSSRNLSTQIPICCKCFAIPKCTGAPQIHNYFAVQFHNSYGLFDLGPNYVR